MRRVLAILLAFLLPLQFSWVAAAPYCGHEATAAGAQHLGHHEHQHVDADHVASGDEAKSAGAIHADCAPCVGIGACMPGSALVVVADSRVAPPCGAVDEATQAAATSPPERPQWARLA